MGTHSYRSTKNTKIKIKKGREEKFARRWDIWASEGTALEVGVFQNEFPFEICVCFPSKDNVCFVWWGLFYE
jgi:hypothetical protein